jgi:hypothetical protein
MLEDARAGQHLAGMAEEQLQQRELLGRQVQLDLGAPGAPPRRVQPQVADLQHGRALDPAAAHQGAHPRGQLGEAERLDEIVVGAGVQPHDTVVDRVPGGQQEHRRPAALRAQPPGDLQPVHAGQHDVQDDRVVVRLGRVPQRLRAVAGRVDGIALLLEATLEQQRQAHLVLHDEHSHASSMTPSDVRTM